MSEFTQAAKSQAVPQVIEGSQSFPNRSPIAPPASLGKQNHCTEKASLGTAYIRPLQFVIHPIGRSCEKTPSGSTYLQISRIFSISQCFWQLRTTPPRRRPANASAPIPVRIRFGANAKNPVLTIRFPTIKARKRIKFKKFPHTPSGRNLFFRDGPRVRPQNSITP